MSRHSIISIVLIMLLIIGLVLVRFFQNDLFYDPLNDYFHINFQNLPFPEMNLWQLMVSNSVRYLMNVVLSLGILWFLYKKTSFVKAGMWVYLFAFVILNAAILVLLQLDSSLAKMALFYTRRFLIHPLLLFILVAGCYYLKKEQSKL